MPTEENVEDGVDGDAETCAEEGRCYMMDTEFKTPGGFLVAAVNLSIGSRVLDHQGKTRTVTWCRKLPKKKRVLVDLHTKPLTVTSSHRVVVPGGETEAKHLKQDDEVLIGSTSQRLRKVVKYHKYIEVMELEFAEDAIVEVHAPSILTKGSDPTTSIDDGGNVKCKEEPSEESSMSLDAEPLVVSTEAMSQHTELTGASQTWPDTDDEMR